MDHSSHNLDQFYLLHLYFATFLHSVVVLVPSLLAFEPFVQWALGIHSLPETLKNILKDPITLLTQIVLIQVVLYLVFSFR